jgi:hypothetical protein
MVEFADGEDVFTGFGGYTECLRNPKPPFRGKLTARKREREHFIAGLKSVLWIRRSSGRFVPVLVPSFASSGLIG